MNQRNVSYNVVDAFGRTVNSQPLASHKEAEALAYEQYKRTFPRLNARIKTEGWECEPCHAHALAKCTIVLARVE